MNSVGQVLAELKKKASDKTRATFLRHGAPESILGVKVGDLAMAGSVSNTKYAVSAQFVTSGLVGAVAGVRFLMQATGTRKGDTFLPRSYSEDMDTGKRESRVALRWSGGVATASGSEVGGRPYKVTKAQQKGAVDPLTGIFLVRGRKGLAGRGGVLMGLGFLLPLVYVIFELYV